MTKEDAVRLLRGGKEGIQEWNALDRARHGLLDLAGVDLEGANLGEVFFYDTNLRDANLRGVYAHGARFMNADLSNANLERGWFQAATFQSGTLRGAYAHFAGLVAADLAHTDLRGASLSQAMMQGACLLGADLSDSVMLSVDLNRADCREAVFRGANLQGSNLNGTNLDGADFSGAILGKNTIDTSLRRVIGLDAVRHLNPSGVSIQALLSLRMPLPEAFLRGCGVRDKEIDYLRTASSLPVFPSCFISYSTADEEFVRELYRDLQANGVRCWFAPHDMRGGQKLHEQIVGAIKAHDRVLIVLSQNSMMSEWVRTEIASAREREVTEGTRVLFPITLVPFEAIRNWSAFDADIGKDAAREIREYFIPDFGAWKQNGEAYKHALRRLLQDLADLKMDK